MSRYRRAKATGSSYFFTVVAYRRQPILCDKAIRNALRASFDISPPCACGVYAHDWAVAMESAVLGYD
ncbi:MAG: hypothetical protein K8R50_02710 [Betaproteobacteria bacterium]|nr:hypothetical protein [Betaproteobacteria bacterium]MCX7196374.1 hypothetical protein [Pseudomonadota bacterium]